VVAIAEDVVPIATWKSEMTTVVIVAVPLGVVRGVGIRSISSPGPTALGTTTATTRASQMKRLLSMIFLHPSSNGTAAHHPKVQIRFFSQTPKARHPSLNNHRCPDPPKSNLHRGRLRRPPRRLPLFDSLYRLGIPSCQRPPLPLARHRQPPPRPRLPLLRLLPQLQLLPLHLPRKCHATNSPLLLPSIPSSSSFIPSPKAIQIMSTMTNIILLLGLRPFRFHHRRRRHSQRPIRLPKPPPATKHPLPSPKKPTTPRPPEAAPPFTISPTPSSKESKTSPPPSRRWEIPVLPLEGTSPKRGGMTRASSSPSSRGTNRGITERAFRRSSVEGQFLLRQRRPDTEPRRKTERRRRAPPPPFWSSWGRLPPR